MKPKCAKISGPKLFPDECKVCDAPSVPCVGLRGGTRLCVPCYHLKQAKYDTRGLCCRRGCKKKAAKGLMCFMHAQRRWAKKNPEKYAWMVLRNNARRRGKDFDLSFREFQRLNRKSSYLELRGRGRDDLTIDRIRNSEGYNAKNVRVITNEENNRKHTKELDEGDPF